MKHTSIPPFYVGQEVVAVINHSAGDFKKGDTFKVTSCEPSNCLCGGWDVTIGISENCPFDSLCVVCGCETAYPAGSEVKYRSYSFAPITSTFQSITLEKVLEEETKLIGVN